MNKPFKDKSGKLRFDLIPPEFDKAFAEVATIGIEKLKASGVENPERNWEQGLKLVGDHLAAVKRHINKWEMGEDLNKEKGMEDKALNHLKHALWHIGAMVTQIDRGRNDLDDRVLKHCPKGTTLIKTIIQREIDLGVIETDRYGYPITWRKQDTNTKIPEQAPSQADSKYYGPGQGISCTKQQKEDSIDTRWEPPEDDWRNYVSTPTLNSHQTALDRFKEFWRQGCPINKPEKS